MVFKARFIIPILILFFFTRHNLLIDLRCRENGFPVWQRLIVGTFKFKEAVTRVLAMLYRTMASISTTYFPQNKK